MDKPSLSATVVFAASRIQVIKDIKVEYGCTIGEAVKRSAIMEDIPKSYISEFALSIWGKSVGVDALIEDGDRIEICRPIVANPKEKRRLRAEKRKKQLD